MGCSPSHQVVPSPGKVMATFPLRPSFQFNERLAVYADDVTGLDTIPPPIQPSTSKSDILELEKFVDIDHRATMAPDNLLHQPYNKLMEFLLTGIKDELSKVRIIFRWVTAQPLDNMTIRDEPDSSLPLYQFWRIQQGKGNYAQLILTMCRLAGISCVIINGLMKGSTYIIGQQVTSETLYGEWNAVLIDDNWRFLNAYWGACGEGDEDEVAEKSTKKKARKKKSVYNCDENYFLTDPEHLSASHHPFVKEWQLLKNPISLGRFEEMAFLKDRFFNLNMSLVTHDKCIVRSLNGDVDFRFHIPAETSVNLKFRHILSRLPTTIVPSVGGEAVKQNQYAFVHKIQPDILSVEVRVPEAGVYRLELVGKDSSIDKPGYDYDWIVLYKIVVDKGLGVCPPYPITSPAGWGPGFEAHTLKLTPVTHKTGRVKAPHGEVEIRFNVGKASSKTLKFSHQLSSATTEDAALSEHVVHWRDKEEVVFLVRTPTRGEYALSLFASDASNNIENFCNYLVTSEQTGRHEAFPRDFGEGAGPRDGLVDMGVRLVSHNAPVIRAHREEVKIVFEMKKPIELFAALSGVGLKAADSKRLVKQYTKGNFVHFSVRMPAKGSYGLKVVGMDPTATKTFQNIYDYLIEFKKSKPLKGDSTIAEEPIESTLQKQESQISIISDLNEASNPVEVGQPPIQEEVKMPVDDIPEIPKPEPPKPEVPFPIQPDPRVGRIQQRMRQAVVEKDEGELEKAISDMRELNLLYTGPEEARAQLDLDVMRTRNEILQACKSGDQAQLQVALDNLKTRQLQKVLRKEMLRAQRLLDRHSNILKNLHDVMELTYVTIAEIKSFSNPPVDVKRTMMATFLLLGHFEEETENWKYICLQLSRIGNDSFKNRILELDPATVPADIALGAKELLGDITFQRILCVSAGAAAFYVWAQNVIKEVEDRCGDEISEVIPRRRRSPKEITQEEEDEN